MKSIFAQNGAVQMEVLQRAYQPELWHESFVVLGTASAALAGLIIVAASVRAEEIMQKPYWRLRARNSTLGMIAITFDSVLVIAPQETVLLGIELMILNTIYACLLPGPTILHQLRQRTGLPIRIPLMAACFYLFSVAGGLSLLLRSGGGLYLTLIAYFGLLVMAVINAYGLLLPYSTSPSGRSA